MRRLLPPLLVILFAVGFPLGCRNATPPPADEPDAGGRAAPTWSAAEVLTVDGFAVPESVVVDPATGNAYVSNIESTPEEYWAEDGKSFLSKLKPGGELETLRWVDSTPAATLHAAKGLCLADGVLYANDNTRVARVDLSTGKRLPNLEVPGAQRLNDLATDGTHVYTSDTGTGKVYRLGEPQHQLIPAPEGVNGLTCVDGKLFAVSWALHEVYELDPAGKASPVAFGLARHFTNLDGIEVLDDGTFVVSDFKGNKVCTIAADRKTVHTLIELDSPADIGLDRERSLLYVPQFMKNRVAVYKLTPPAD